MGEMSAAADDATERDDSGRAEIGADVGARVEAGVEAGVEAAVEAEPASAAAVFGDRLQVARDYVRLLAVEGVLRGLVGPREAGRLWTRHVLNCAVLGELIPRGARVVDVGSGAGLPGVVLAIVRTDCDVILVEPLERRVRFLEEAIRRLGLSNCAVVRSRAQDAPVQARGADVVVSRAVAPLGKLAGWCAVLARPGGTILALKGATADEELRRDRAEVAAAGLRDAAVERVEGPAGPAFVVRATRHSRREGHTSRHTSGPGSGSARTLGRRGGRRRPPSS